jgi:hypothetical protein
LLFVRIVVGMGLFTALIWYAVDQRVRRAGRLLRRDLAGERILRGPMKATLRGETTRKFDMGQLALTEGQLVYYRTVGDPIRLARADIAGARAEKWFRHARSFGRPHVVITTKSGDEYGFLVRQPDAWISALGSGRG